MDKLKQEQDRISRLQAENHAALKAAQDGTEADGWKTIERTPERQNMTKPEAVTQEAIQAAKDYLRGNGPWKDSEIGITEDDYLVQCFAKAIQAAQERGFESGFDAITDRIQQEANEQIQAAEQRGADRERERCALLSEDIGAGWCDERTYTAQRIAQAIRKGETP